MWILVVLWMIRIWPSDEVPGVLVVKQFPYRSFLISVLSVVVLPWWRWSCEFLESIPFLAKICAGFGALLQLWSFFNMDSNPNFKSAPHRGVVDRVWSCDHGRWAWHACHERQSQLQGCVMPPIHAPFQSLPPLHSSQLLRARHSLGKNGLAYQTTGSFMTSGRHSGFWCLKST